MIRARLEAITTKDDWIETVLFRDKEDGTAFDLTGCTAELAVRKIGRNSVDTVASTDNGRIVFPATGYLHWQVLDAEYAFCVGEYEIRLTLERDGFTSSIIIGTLPVLDGMA